LDLSRSDNPDCVGNGWRESFVSAINPGLEVVPILPGHILVFGKDTTDVATVLVAKALKRRLPVLFQ
jgi:hypothetical protein